MDTLTYTDQDPFGISLPVQLFDDITVKPGCQQKVIDLFTNEYSALAAERGLRLVGLWLLPAFERPKDPADILIQWEYPSIEQLWTSRYTEENDPRLTDFWRKVDALILRRSRRLGRTPPLMTGMLPEPNLASMLAPARHPERTRYIAIVKPDAELAPTEQAAWQAAAEALAGQDGIAVSRAGFHVDYSYFPGSFTWDVVTTGGRQIDPETLLKALPGAARISEFVQLGAPMESGFRKPDIRNGIRRVILFRVPETVTDAAREKVEKTNLDWAHHMPYTRNWSLSRVTNSQGSVNWTHCVDHEFDSIADLTGPYLYHPYHWSLADRLFHREDPDQSVHEFLHTMYGARDSVLGEILR